MGTSRASKVVHICHSKQSRYVDGYVCTRCNTEHTSWAALSAHLRMIHDIQGGANPGRLRYEALAELRRAVAFQYTVAQDGSKQIQRSTLPALTMPVTQRDVTDSKRQNRESDVPGWNSHCYCLHLLALAQPTSEVQQKSFTRAEGWQHSCAAVPVAEGQVQDREAA